MGGVLQVIFFLWLGWVVLVVVYHVVVGIFQFLKEILGSFFDTPAPPSRPVTGQGHSSPTADSRQSTHNHSKPSAPVVATAQPKNPTVIQPSGTGFIPAYRRPAKLELAVDYNARITGSSFIVVRVRGGPAGYRVGGITYALSCSVNVHQLDYALGDRRSGAVNPDVYMGLYALNTPLPEDDAWATLAVIPLELVLPPRGGSFRYHFKCLAYASANKTYDGAPCAVGGVLNDAEFSTIFTLSGPGYLDEIDWLSLREKLLSFLEGLIQGCEDDIPDKRSKVRAFVESLDPPATSGARHAMLKVAIERAYISAKPRPAIDFGIIDAVRMSNDAVLVEAMARLTYHLACREPLSSDARKAFAKIRATYDVNVNGHHVRYIDPLPPVASVVTPAPTPTPKPSPAVPSFELKLEPIEEAGRVKAAEVHVRGFTGSLLVSQPELIFWLWDEASGDNAFKISAADIDLVHQRAVHHRSWKAGEYDSTIWQSAGVVRFNDFLPPAGGSRRISVAGKFGAKSASSFIDFAKTVRSAAVTINVATLGYESIRNRRQGLRYRAFVLAVGLALLSGKGPTYRQDKALKKFAQTLCAGIIDRKLAESYQNDLLTLLDSNVDDSLYGLTKHLDQLADQAYPELKPQLLEALVEVMASRKARSKQSRHFLEYSRGVLT
jgi:hypothetical protein